jgi:hypothetical protein
MDLNPQLIIYWCMAISNPNLQVGKRARSNPLNMRELNTTRDKS